MEDEVKVPVPGKVRGKLFAGALWLVNDRQLEVLSWTDEGVVNLTDDSSEDITMDVQELAKGTFKGDKYANDNLD